MDKHLIFFDGLCAFCNQTVRIVLHLDKKKKFLFAPLSGKTAEKELSNKQTKENSMVLIENYQTPKQKIWLRGRGACRILWLLGGKWRLIGWLCYFPIGVDLFYRLVARHRHRLSKKLKFQDFSKHQDRFLP